MSGKDRSAGPRPRFAARYPRTPDLDRLVEAFELGNFALVRREAPKLAESTADEDVRRAAQELRRRIEPDPTSIYLLGVGVALLVLLYSYWLMQGH